MTSKEKFQAIDQSKLNEKLVSALGKLEKASKGFTVQNDKVDASLTKIYDALKAKKPEALKDIKVVKPKETKKKDEPKKDQKPKKPKLEKKDNYTKTPTPSTPKGKKENFTKQVKKYAKENDLTFKEAQKKLSEEKKKEKKKDEDNINTELKKLREIVNSKEFKDQLKGEEYPKKYGKEKGSKTSLSSDAKRQALPVGRRTSKNGNIYYEYRDNMSDRNSLGKDDDGNIIYRGDAPPFLEKGGKLEDGGVIDGFTLQAIQDYPDNGDLLIVGTENTISLAKGGKLEDNLIATKFDGSDAKKGDIAIVKETKKLGTITKIDGDIFDVKFKGGKTHRFNVNALRFYEKYEKGGSVDPKKKKRSKQAIAKDRKYYNPNQPWEVRYAEKNGRKKVGYQKKNSKAKGGELEELKKMIESSKSKSKKDLFKKGGKLENTEYIPAYEVLTVKTKDGIIYDNMDESNQILNGVYVSDKQVNRSDIDESQMKLFVFGGETFYSDYENLPKKSKYIKRGDIDEVTVDYRDPIDGKYILNGFHVYNLTQNRIKTSEAKKSKKKTKKGSKDSSKSVDSQIKALLNGDAGRGINMKIAGIIRKDDESWNQARKRASEIMENHKK